MININGVSYQGNSISVTNGKVLIDGVDAGIEGKEISIVVDGDLGSLSVDSCNYVKVSGNCDQVKTMSGDIEVGGDVMGDCKTMSGDIACGHIFGGAETKSGDFTQLGYPKH